MSGPTKVRKQGELFLSSTERRALAVRALFGCVVLRTVDGDSQDACTALYRGFLRMGDEELQTTAREIEAEAMREGRATFGEYTGIAATNLAAWKDK